MRRVEDSPYALMDVLDTAVTFHLTGCDKSASGPSDAPATVPHLASPQALFHAFSPRKWKTTEHLE
jgi:hypothetical protein